MRRERARNHQGETDVSGQSLLQNRRFVMAVILMAALLAAIIVSEIWTANTPIPVASDMAAVLCAGIAAILYVWAWSKMASQDVAKRVWGLLALGIVLWTLAEAMWAFYEMVLQLEIPYPSVADLFWLAGYVPFYLALFLRYRSLQAVASPRQRWIVWLFVVLYTGLLTAYVILPVLEEFDASRLAEGLTNIAYPLADWGLCVLTLVIIFSLERGRFATVWRLFGAGMLLVATADLVYFYASWNGLYYPEGHVNFVSGLLDLLFNASYLMLGLAVFAYAILGESLAPSRFNLVLKALAKMEVLVFVNAEGHILSVSDNFMNLVRVPAKQPYIGMDLAKALGIEAARGQDLLSRILDQKSLMNYPIRIRDTRGEEKYAWLTSLLIVNEEGRRESTALVVRADPPPAGEKEFPLHEDQRMLIDYYLAKSGASRAEEDETIRTYFLGQINLLHSLIQQYSGASIADKMLEHLSQTARLNNWQFSYAAQDIRIPEHIGGESLRDLLLPLLEDAGNYAADVTSQSMVEQEMKSLDKNLETGALSILDKYRFHPVLGRQAAPAPQIAVAA